MLDNVIKYDGIVFPDYIFICPLCKKEEESWEGFLKHFQSSHYHDVFKSPNKPYNNDGLYCLVQFTIDSIRFVNVGVVVIHESSNKFSARMINNIEKIKATFGNIDEEYCLNEIHNFNLLLRYGTGCDQNTPESLEKLLKSFSGHIEVTPFKPVKVYDMERIVERLQEEFF